MGMGACRVMMEGESRAVPLSVRLRLKRWRGSGSGSPFRRGAGTLRGGKVEVGLGWMWAGVDVEWPVGEEVEGSLGEEE
jgi:hypothetical protein